MLPEQTEFVQAVQHAATTFEAHKQELGDLSRRFWAALVDLELGSVADDWEELRETFNAARRQLGAPGDFGYGTPCGDALKALYAKWAALCKAHAPVAVEAPDERAVPSVM